MSTSKVKRVPGDLKWVAACVAVLPADVAVRAWVLSVMWGWFVVPLGVSPITALHAYGITLTVRVLRGSRPAPQDEQERTFRELFWRACLPAFGTLVGLGVGWLVAGMP